MPLFLQLGILFFSLSLIDIYELDIRKLVDLLIPNDSELFEY